jgi:CubicO group peptidase (beta-lactamase class C family)
MVPSVAASSGWRLLPMFLKPATRRAAALLGTAALAALAGAAQAQVASAVPVAIQEVRRQMLNPPGNSLYFHNMDELFDTRVVGRSGEVWRLPRADHRIDVGYTWMGQPRTPDEFLERTFTNALLVIKDGKIVTEIYRNRTDEKTRFMSWSMAKSFTSTLVGFAVAEGKIKSLDEPLTRYLPELKGGGYDGVTIRQTLEMRSGVDYDERYDFDHPSVAQEVFEKALVRNEARFADVAKTLKRKHPPGEVFEYKTIDTAVLGWLVERVADRSAAAYMGQRLWEPLGAEADGYFIMDGPPGVGREFTGAGFNATLRDYGRFGLMMLNNGYGNGRQIVSPQWVAEATKPAGPEGERGGYGYQWWTVAKSDAYFALGLEGQFIYVDPASKTVIVKMSYIPLDKTDVIGEVLTYFDAIARWTPKP